MTVLLSGLCHRCYKWIQPPLSIFLLTKLISLPHGIVMHALLVVQATQQQDVRITAYCEHVTDDFEKRWAN